MSKDKQRSIPISKVKRAAKIVGAGAKVGGNYMKYYTKKAFNPSLSEDTLHSDNAEDIYATLSELKGSALKVAQMVSMDQQVLPKAYQDKFALAQYKAPALSYPLIIKTFSKYFDQSPNEIFDLFTKDAVHAASIGQVHQAEKDGKKLAVKIQYPGVAEAISSDLKLIRPLASRLFNMKSSDLKMYMDEVESKLLEETDYMLESRRGQQIADQSKEMKGLVFANYYPALSSERVLTMDWIDGRPFQVFCEEEKNQVNRNKIGQYMWDFFLFQMKELGIVHADPHPGNFLITSENQLAVLDFGCVKEIPAHFAENYFQLLKPGISEDQNKLEQIYESIEFFKPEDTPAEKALLRSLYREMIDLLGRPFHQDHFDFGDPAFFQEIFKKGEAFSSNKDLRKMNNARGSRDAIYVMRTFFGLYNLLHQLKATVKLNYKLYD